MKTLRRLRRALVCAAMSALLASAWGCDIFDTREAADPGGEGSTWQVPNVPSRVLVNLESGLEELTGTNYERSLADNFEFEPLPEDEQDPTFPPGKFDNWTREVEIAVVNRMVSENGAIEVTLRIVETEEDTNQSAKYKVDYTLIITSFGQPGTDTEYRGQARFNMINGSKGWQLTRWEDIAPVDGFDTWGFLRGTLRQP